MKHLRTLFAIALATVVITACAQKVTFPSLVNKQGITNIYITKAMLGMVSNYGSMPGNVPDELLKKLDSIEVITSEEVENCAAITETVKAFIAENPELEILMNVNDDGDNVTIYGVPKAGTENYSKIIMNIADSDGEVVVLVMTGDIAPSDLSEMDL